MKFAVRASHCFKAIRHARLFSETSGTWEVLLQSVVVPSFPHRVPGPIRRNEDVCRSARKDIDLIKKLLIDCLFLKERGKWK